MSKPRDRKMVEVIGVDPDTFPDSITIEVQQPREHDHINVMRLTATKPWRNSRKREPMPGDKIRLHWPDVPHMHGTHWEVVSNRITFHGYVSYKLSNKEYGEFYASRELIRFTDNDPGVRG